MENEEEYGSYEEFKEYKETEFLKLFPEIEDVFEKDLEVYRKWVLPLCSIELRLINPEWTGKIFAVYFNNDPYNRDPAMLASFNQYNNDYTMSFKIVNGKYELSTSLDYFLLSDDWVEYYEDGLECYAFAKKRFKEKGILNLLDENSSYYTEEYSNPFIKNLGRKPAWLQTEQTPLDPDGNPMTFIAQLNTGDYIGDGCDEEMYIFYSHEHQLVVQTGQIT